MLLVLALLSCKADPDEAQPAAWVDHSAVVGVEVVPSIGPAPHAVVVRAVNELGATVHSDPTSVGVDGTDRAVAFDGAGYGELLFDLPGSFTVQDDLGEVEVHAVDSDWPGLGAWPAQVHELDVTDAAPATTGGLLAAGSEVWWTSATSAHSVLRFPADQTVQGVRTAHIDADGILDGLAWASGTLVLLKGRLDGGMSWAATLQGEEGYVVAGADAHDLDGDGITDLAVAWQGARTHQLQILEGDGLWAFTASDPRYLGQLPYDVGIGDNTADGSPQITVTEEGGRWERYVITQAGEYQAIGPSLDTNFPAESTVLSGFDLLGNGGDPLFIIGPYEPGDSRWLWVYDLTEGSPEYLQLDTPGARFSHADADSDGLTDLWLVYEDGELVLLKSNDGGYRQRKVASLAQHGPLVASDLVGDRTPDALVVGDAAWTVWQGLGPETDESPWWTADEGSWGVWEEQQGGPLARSGEDVAAVVDQDGELRLRVWEVQPGDPASLFEVSMTRLGTYGDDARDLAVCDGVAWVLAPTELIQVDIDGERVLGRMDTTGTRVDCGVGPSGAAAVLLEGSTALLLDADLASVGSQDVGGAQDVALVDLGTGPQIGTCLVDPCRAERWEWGEDGVQALATGTEVELSLTTSTGEVVLPGRGLVSTADVDGDGHDDLLATHEGLITVYRSTGLGIGPAEAWHGTRVLDPPLLAADATGDGHPEVWAWSEGDLVCTP